MAQPILFSDSTINIPPFSGAGTEDVTRWLQRFKNFADFRGLSDRGRAQLLQLLCKDVAADFLESLDDEIKGSFDGPGGLREAFIKRFELPQTLLWKRAADVWHREQSASESVETYMAAIINLAKKADIKDEGQIIAAMIHGFKPSIKQAVLQRPMATVQQIMESARIAEAAAVEVSDVKEISELTRNLQDLTTLVKELVTAPARAVRAVTPPRQVRFEDRQRSPSPANRDRSTQHTTQTRPSRRETNINHGPTQDWTNEAGYPASGNRSHQWNGQRSSNQFRPSAPQNGRYNPRQAASANNYPSGQPSFVCGRCSLQHPRGQCPAYGQICRKCLATGHYGRACRATQQQFPSQ
jgi:hypothetical protein